MRALRYFLDEAVASLWRGAKTTLIAIVTIAVAFFVLGGFLMITTNLERLLSRWQEAAEFSVYLRDEAAAEQRTGIETVLRGSHLVRALEVISKEEALKRFKRDFGALAEATGDLTENPLPASIEVRLVPDANPADVQALAAKASSLPGVADVRYDRQWIQRLTRAVDLVRAGGFGLAAILVLAAALTVASVIRLALVVRREEIHIMQLVGAPLGYIGGPFVVEGLLQGGAGAGIALGMLWMTFLFARARMNPLLINGIDPAGLAFLPLSMIAAILAGGMIVGCIGGLIAARTAREIAD
ncbi:MAG: ABC transporter permease [Vicinamibacterales bacterium]|nr:ABC transporter permease [Vicinamibacterales bacterium]